MTPDPIDAQCALHPGVAASVTCGRCGNFMCNTCSEFGSQTRCPTCRALATESVFPLGPDADLSRQFEHVLEAFKRDWAMLLLGGVLAAGAYLIGSMISQIAGLAVAAVIGLLGGKGVLTVVLTVLANLVLMLGIQLPVQAFGSLAMYRLMIDSLCGRPMRIERAFENPMVALRAGAVQLAIYLGFLLLLGICAAPLLAFGFKFGSPEEMVRNIGHFLPFFGLLWVVLMAASIVALPVLVFAPFEFAYSGASITEAVRRSWLLGNGQRLRMIGYAFVSGLMVFVGVLACVVGAVPALLLGILLQCS